MELQVRREALRVAAKLAFAGAAFACGGKLAPEDAADEASVDAADEEAATTACVVTPDAAFDVATNTCCTDMIAAALDASLFDHANTQQTNCCEYLDEYATYASFNFDAGTSVAYQCCYLTDSKSAFCNPWGPPTPPAMA